MGHFVEDESFYKLETSLAHKKGVRDPKALAAAIGRAHGKIPGKDTGTAHDPSNGQFTSGSGGSGSGGKTESRRRFSTLSSEQLKEKLSKPGSNFSTMNRRAMREELEYRRGANKD